MGAASARHSLRPLFSRDTVLHNSGDPAPRERATISVSRHCEERKRRSNPFFLCGVRWIASLTLAMTVSELDVRKWNRKSGDPRTPYAAAATTRLRPSFLAR